MGAFLLGLIVGFAITVALFIYDEGEVFIKLARQVKQVVARYKGTQQAS